MGIRPLFAQTIHLKLAYHANRSVTLLAIQGVRKDSLQSIVLDAQGKGAFNLTGIKTQAGMVGLVIKTSSPPDITFDWVYSPTENISIVGDEEYVHKQNTQILNSPENTTLDRWYMNRYVLKQKHGLSKELAHFYQPTETTYKTLQSEQQKIEKDLGLLADSISHSSLFSATYMQFMIDAEQKWGGIFGSDSAKKVAQNYFRSLDFEKLYPTGLWFNTINGISELYSKYNPAYHKHFGEDMVYNLRRTKNVASYIAMADAALSICNANSWHYDEQQLISFLLDERRLEHIEKLPSKLQKLAATYHVSVGQQAPDLIVIKNTSQGKIAEVEILPTDQLSEHYTLLVFHETGCGNCDRLLTELRKTYTDWQAKQVRLLSIAADKDEPTFKQAAAQLPWEDKYCDLKGFAGVNFKNYAIIGTPTMFLVDKNGKILVKTAIISEVSDFLKQAAGQLNK